ncbi:MAG: putative topoisomerase, type, partial [Ramlibacter sp.]|nr:putative topoisomerase, type [Ramlibacter sp.]
DTTMLRVGNEEYASTNGSYGLTTLRNRHAAVQGQALRLRFRGKSGVMHEARLDDPRVARVVRQCQQLPGQALFQYAEEGGEPHSVSSTDVNDYLAEAARGERFTAKDFRTWHGSVLALETLRILCGKGEPVSLKLVLGAVSAVLGNTPAVCRKAYIHPEVLALAQRLAAEGGAPDFPAAPARGLSAAEQRLIACLSGTAADSRRAA